MLNSGEVPNLFPPDEYEQIIAAVRPKAMDHGIAEGDRWVWGCGGVGVWIVRDIAAEDCDRKKKVPPVRLELTTFRL